MQEAQAIEKPITLEEAADFLSMPYRTVSQRAAEGKIPSFKPGRRRLFLRSQLLEWAKGTGSQSPAKAE